MFFIALLSIDQEVRQFLKCLASVIAVRGGNLTHMHSKTGWYSLFSLHYKEKINE